MLLRPILVIAKCARHGSRIRCLSLPATSTAQTSASIQSSPVVEAAQAPSVATEQAPIATKPRRSDYWYMGWGTFGAIFFGAPLLAIAHAQDNGDFRDVFEDTLPPAIMAFIRQIWTVPYREPAGWRESDQPKREGQVHAIVAKAGGLVDVVTAPASAKLPSVQAMSMLGPVDDADSTARFIRRRQYGPSNLLHRQGTWSLESPVTLKEQLAAVDDDIGAEGARVSSLSQSSSEARRVMHDVCVERLAALEARRGELQARLQGFASAPQLRITSAVPGLSTPQESSGRGWLSWALGSRESAPADDGSLVDPLDPYDVEPTAQLELLGASGAPAKQGAKVAVAPAPSWRLFWEAGEAARAAARVRRIELNSYVRGEGEAALSAAYVASGEDRHAVKRTTWDDVMAAASGPKEADPEGAAAHAGPGAASASSPVPA